MATSGSTDFSISRTTIINDVCEDLNLKSEGQPVANHIKTKAILRLQAMIKADMMDGLHLWAIADGTLFFVLNQESYTLGTGGDEASASYLKTEVATAQTSGNNTLVVDSTTGMTAGDNIGIELDGGDLQWTTITSVDSSTQVTLDANLTDDVAVDNHVYTYTTIIEKPIRIIPDTIRIENSSGMETPVHLVSRSDYMSIPDKSSSGVTNKVFYEPLRTTGKLYIWPVADDVQRVLHFNYERTLEDMDAAGNEPDYPIQFAEYLMAGLRYRMGRIAGMTDQELITAKAEADSEKQRCLDFDSEEGSLFFQPG